MYRIATMRTGAVATTLGSLQLRLLPRSDSPRCIFNRSLIPIHAQSTDNRLRLVAEIAMVSEGLAFMDVADVYFDKGDLDTQQRVSQSHTSVRESTWVDHDGINLSSRLVNAVNQGAFMV